MKYLLFSIYLLLFCACKPDSTTENAVAADSAEINKTVAVEVPKSSAEAIPVIQRDPHHYPWKRSVATYTTIAERIAAPEGYKRIEATKLSFASWLRNLPVKEQDAKVYLFDKSKKWNQNAQYAVVDMDVDPVDLQQCADAVMRLKAEFHYSKKEFDKIHFNFTSGDKVSFDDWRKGRQPKISGNKVTFTSNGTKGDDYKNFRRYLRQIFTYAGTASLTKELRRVDIKAIAPGDVFIQGGHPGHAVMVLDVVENELGDKQFLIGQSYMPAQDFHILKNPNSRSPWYSVDFGETLKTPEWEFKKSDLKRFQ